MATEFRNEALTDFSKEENARAMRAAIEKVKGQLGREYPLVIGGERITTNSKLESINPANRTQVVGIFNKATKDLARRAVEVAKRFRPGVTRDLNSAPTCYFALPLCYANGNTKCPPG